MPRKIFPSVLDQNLWPKRRPGEKYNLQETRKVVKENF
jgi:hypothetical protein